MSTRRPTRHAAASRRRTFGRATATTTAVLAGALIAWGCGDAPAPSGHERAAASADAGSGVSDGGTDSGSGTGTSTGTGGSAGACSDYSALRNPYFGDLHVHTSYSFDAYAFGNRNDPAAAYRFAKGQTIYLAPLDENGQGTRAFRLERRLDFAAATDHSEYLGETSLCTTPGSPGYYSLTCINYRNNPLVAFAAFGVPLTQEDPSRAAMCGAGDIKCLTRARTVWQRIITAADDAYNKCSFTALVAYEWTGTTGGDNLHRNVVFSGDTVPSQPVSYFEEPTPQGLWAALTQRCKSQPGCDVLAIPHNSNLSGGNMWKAPKSTSEAALRASLEPLVEIVQHKGESECQNTLINNDEACGFEKMSSKQQPAMSFVRQALKEGLRQQLIYGVNPFKLGIIGATDTHNSTPGAVEEANFAGHMAGQDDTVAKRVTNGGNTNPGGLTVAWAEQNSREAIFAALSRRETYATSGTRPTVRFFGGWSYGAAICGKSDQEIARLGYAGGVPMGGTLSKQPAGAGAPVFVIRALRDPGTTPSAGIDLQRLQVIKGWVENGILHHHVYTVAGSADNGAGVDLSTCTPQGSGHATMCVRWQDPDFNPSKLAFYYVRVLENPSCRWSWRQCLAAGVSCDTAQTGWKKKCCELPKTVQERAWTSPIWYQP